MSENGAMRPAGETLELGVEDSRKVMAYLVATGSDDYIAIMGILDGSVTDVSPTELTSKLHQAGRPLDTRTVVARLESLRRWGAVTPRQDNSRARRYEDMAAANWRYTATLPGRHVHRFYMTVLAGSTVAREIPLTSLRQIVESLETLAAQQAGPARPSPEKVARLVALVFTGHDSLDGALVGAEDDITGLADRFDLDVANTGELKRLLVDYATKVAAELEHGAARAHTALLSLAPHTGDLVDTTLTVSSARALIERGALTASRGGRQEDWAGLLAWFDPAHGRCARFALRLVRALPGMHANLRRLHTSGGTATTRARALAFARACADLEHGTAVWHAALGDHSWRKLSGTYPDEELIHGAASWRDDGGVELSELLRVAGRSGARGRAAPVRDDTEARRRVAELRTARTAAHTEALLEILTSSPGSEFSDHAARVALAALMIAARTPADARGHRTATKDGLSATLAPSDSTAVLRAPTWQVLVPGRTLMFHQHGTPVRVPEPATQAAAGPEAVDQPVTLRLVSGAA